MGKDHQKFGNSKKIEDVKSHGAEEEEEAAASPFRPTHTLLRRSHGRRWLCRRRESSRQYESAQFYGSLTVVVWRSDYEFVAAGFVETLVFVIGCESGADIEFSFASVIVQIFVIKFTMSTIALISLIIPTATPTLPMRLPRMSTTDTKNVGWEWIVEFKKDDCLLDRGIN